MRETNFDRLKKMDWPGRVAYIAGYIAIALLMVYLFQVLWNLVFPAVFGLPELSYPQALALKAMFILIK